MVVQLLSDLPAELLLRVGEHLPLADCRSLSTVNSQFRRFLLPTLFEGLRASNETEHAEVFQQLIPQIARHVQRLNFELHFGEEDDDEERQRRKLIDLTIEGADPIVWDLLNRNALPNVSSFRLTFCPHPADYGGDTFDNDWCGGQINIHQEVESLEEVEEKERDFAWRALYKKAVETICNGPGTLRRLEICNLPPKATSAFLTAEWRALLNGLEEFELGVWGGENDGGMNSNTLPGYIEHVEALKVLFFEHLMEAKRIKFAAHRDNPVGCPGWRQCPLPFGANHMPKLEHLVLRHCFVDFALIACLDSKPGQLKSLRLIECYSAGSGNQTGLADASLSWAAFFSALQKCQFNLQEFVLEEELPPALTVEERCERQTPEDCRGSREESEDVQAVRRELEADPRRRLFQYMRLDDKYGWVFEYEEVMVPCFWAGEDEREFDAFVEMVRENQSKASA